ncbi:hypothetical protein MHZ90_18070 [Pantoea sp. ACRSH]|uniref:hypothetical protein n=1 Tax=unclassified Pantoea TaxID=2630326 RepID=UPI001EF6A9BF|nr:MULTISPECIES: hypothetical protein [unclassified Pantoea]MCG7368019.1 hypothetical protein [Pantoea sp. ACRSH]MCG7398378.1 hypothetical protein [Pantoea sp. ACRSC]
MNDGSLITSIGALLLGGGAVALFWKPLIAGIAAIVTNSKAGGEVITGYKEQVLLLKESNNLLRQENDDLRDRHDRNMRRISSLETDLRLIKNALSILLAMSDATSAAGNEKFRSEVTRLISSLEDGSDGSSQ